MTVSDASFIRNELPPALRHRFRILVFDWDGTAVRNRRDDAGALRSRLERLLERETLVVVVTGTNLGNIDLQLSHSILGRHKKNLYLATNRGSEVYGFRENLKPILLWKREATSDEERLLTETADAVREHLRRGTGLDFRVVYDRLNRRKIDLIALEEWADPPKSEIGRLLEAVDGRLRSAGLSGGLKEVMEMTRRAALGRGLLDARLTTDVKHVEIGLTDKGDSVDWVLRSLARPRGVPNEDILIAGDEFGPLAGIPGSDSLMMTPSAKGAVFVSVGPEPAGVPADVLHVGGGPARFREFLEVQLGFADEASAHLDLPVAPTKDESWTLIEEGFTLAREHEIESIFSIANGYVGTRGSLEEGAPLSSPATFLAGVYDSASHPDAVPELAVASDWLHVRAFLEGRELRLDAGQILSHRRILDVSQGILWREWNHRDEDGRIIQLRSMRLASLADRHVLVQAISLTPLNFGGRVRLETRLEPPVDRPDRIELVLAPAAPLSGAGPDQGRVLELRTTRTGFTIAFAALNRARIDDIVLALPGDGGTERWETTLNRGKTLKLDRRVVVYTSRDGGDPAQEAGEHLKRLASIGIELLVQDHIGAWRNRWCAADVEIKGDREAQRAVRFSVYHLIGAANPEEEMVSLGARALSGELYKGHVFWDTEIFMLPFYLLTDPPTARALLKYRYHTLPAARAKARRMGYQGALYAWESAHSGEETTPPFTVAPDGEVIRILSGEEEHHISADVAFAVWHYWEATGDERFLVDAGAEILFETARFWASRGEDGEDGLYHVRKVIGPDEYHESVNDNAYTNGMAQWNLERAADAADLLQRNWPNSWKALAARLDLSAESAEEWRALAGRVYTGFDPSTGLFEQFRGYHALEEIDLAAYAPRRLPMDILLGRERVGRSKILKQADVLMLLYLLRARYPREVLEANFAYYEPRTGHGSSLSPPVHAALAARLGKVELALRYFRQTAAIDLGNNMGNAAGGVHAAALGGLWQTVAFGFAGMTLGRNRVSLDPYLPAEWSGLRFPIQWRGRRFRIALEPSSIEVLLEDGAPFEASLRDRSPVVVMAGRAARWEVDRKEAAAA